ncbi:unnamed protein product [Acanthoscelides obtectus]|uniref:Uncharacterized protein n=1 Tax=Acanthoscelides obtectus TaxID=200917 RepID=A0A9P0KMW7_ACAOB|nr:unnamed protein product [Acanthoscelides obtectus]CAK1675154.1 hypothetical protein AOBTE_LOCUS29941 [Acanthoscelides obtectus]
MTMYRTVFRPILIFGSESWVLTNRQKSKLQAIDMKGQPKEPLGKTKLETKLLEKSWEWNLYYKGLKKTN